MDSKPLTPEQFLATLHAIFPIGRPWIDTEKAHSEADKLTWSLLTALGYGDGIDFLKQQELWYA